MLEQHVTGHGVHLLSNMLLQQWQNIAFPHLACRAITEIGNGPICTLHICMCALPSRAGHVQQDSVHVFCWAQHACR